jgi:hypothetical protein
VTTYFISYNSADAAMASAVATALYNAGQTVRFAEWELAYGHNIDIWISKAI